MQKLAAAESYQSANHFIYDEKIDAGYINLTRNIKTLRYRQGYGPNIPARRYRRFDQM